MAVGGWVQRRRELVSAAEELMEAEGKDRESGRAPRRAAREQRDLKRALAILHRHAGRIGKRRRDALLAPERPRRAAAVTVIDLAPHDPQGPLDPAGQRIGDRLLVVVGRYSVTNTARQRVEELRVAEIGVIGLRAQRFPYDLFCVDCRAEQAASDARDLGLLLGVRARAGHRGRGAHTAEVVGAASLADTSDEQGNVGALSAAVGVQLIEHQERKAPRRAHHCLVGGPRQQVLEHHVVGQQDVRRAPPDLLTLLLGLLPGEAAERHRLAAVRIPDTQKLGQLELLCSWPARSSDRPRSP